MLDGTGARVAGDAIAYVAWVFVADGTFFATGMLLYKGLDILPRNGRAWGTGMLAAAASYGAYGVSVWAMTRAPIAVVAAVQGLQVGVALVLGVALAVVGQRHHLACGLGRAHAAVLAGAVFVEVIAQVHDQVQVGARGDAGVGVEVFRMKGANA